MKDEGESCCQFPNSEGLLEKGRELRHHCPNASDYDSLCEAYELLKVAFNEKSKGVYSKRVPFDFSINQTTRDVPSY